MLMDQRGSAAEHSTETIVLERKSAAVCESPKRRCLLHPMTVHWYPKGMSISLASIPHSPPMREFQS